MLGATMTDFAFRDVAGVKKRSFRLGLACNFGIDAQAAEAAFERGVNFVYYTRSGTRGVRPAVQAALKRDRERMILCAGTTIGYFGANVRSAAERMLKVLGTDYLDIFLLHWLGVTSAFNDGTVKALLELKAQGKVRAIGVSIHDRPRAGKLAEDSPLDLLMLRYNAAHPGAERDVFPHLERRKPSVIAYTATSWRKLLRRPSGWDGPVMTGPDCYRFCLSSAHVDVVLCGPKSVEELNENLTAIEKGPLTPEEDTWMRRFGAAVHG
jgi:aryl-alcohol dehydrogenase-like predicted oxidoreductase